MVHSFSSTAAKPWLSPKRLTKSTARLIASIGASVVLPGEILSKREVGLGFSLPMKWSSRAVRSVGCDGGGRTIGVLPLVKRGMPRPNADEGPRTVGGGGFRPGWRLETERRYDEGFPIARFDDVGDEADHFVHRRWRDESDGKFSRNRAGGLIEFVSDHQMPGGGPIHMAVEQGADDAAVEHPLVAEVVNGGAKFGDDLIAADKALDSQTEFVLRPTTETGQIRRELVL